MVNRVKGVCTDFDAKIGTGTCLGAAEHGQVSNESMYDLRLLVFHPNRHCHNSNETEFMCT